VVIVCHESADYAPRTLRALAEQLQNGDELLVVDNASSDGTAEAVREAAPEANVLEPRVNLGFAGGCALGAARSSAPLLLFLNPDALPSPGCLDALRACSQARPDWGAWQALVLLPGGREVNTAGNPVHFLGFAWAGEHGRPPPAHSEPTEVASASGAALVVRREAWNAVGGFDERYFMYGEDVDLCLRLRLAGWRIGLAASARVEHDYAFVKGDYKWFHLERNRWWTVLGVYPTRLLVLLTPALLAFELALLLAAWRGGWLAAKVRAQRAVVRALPAILRRRRLIQLGARIEPLTFADGLTYELDSPFLGAPGRSRLLSAMLALHWTAIRRGLGGPRAGRGGTPAYTRPNVR
jgi:GT2 family glycosyltransferase